MSGTASRTVVGSFHDHDQAQRCVGALEQAGFGETEVGMLRKDEAGHTEADGTARDHGRGLGHGVTTGAVEGGLIGAAAAFLIPGAGPVIGAGILGTTILGALTGAAAGGVAGALTGMGMRKEEADHYTRKFEEGDTIVTVRAAGREDEAHQILRKYGADEMVEKGMPAEIAAADDQREIDGRREAAPLEADHRPVEGAVATDPLTRGDAAIRESETVR
ncbi:MAG TPA: hypothetical protein VGR61_02910 [Candidatus Dormibacteraeota bacterium]|nr:hypothetical protein [Candidatus Dormibacteraeota bacterium]